MILNRKRIDEVLNADAIQGMFDISNYKDPTDWMKEHINDHPEYLDSEAPTVSILPFNITLSANGIGYVGKCKCRICGEEHDITEDIDW